MKVIERYGLPVIGYRGACNITVDDRDTRSDFRGYFEVAHFSTGRISVGFIPTQRPQLSRIESGADDLYDLSFSGNDVDGWSLRTIGQTLFSPVAWMLLPGQTQPSELRFSAQYIEATRKGSMPDGYSQARFLVSNLLWHYNQSYDVEPISLMAQNCHVIVSPVDGYQDVAERLVHGQGVEPTAWFCVETAQGQLKTLENFQDLVEDLVCVFRLVTGNLVDWYYGETYDDSTGRTAERIHKFSAASSYSTTIRYNHRRSGHIYGIPKLDLADLTAAFFDRPEHAIDIATLKALINHFTSACDRSQFMEASGLRASTLTDLIVSKRAEAKGTTDIILSNDYVSSVLPKLEAALKDAKLSKEEQHEVQENLRGGYRRSFRKKIRALKDEFDLPLSSHDISRIVDARNALVHRGTFESRFEDRGWRDDYELITWTNLIALCRLLGYRGELPERRKGRPIVV